METEKYVPKENIRISQEFNVNQLNLESRDFIKNFGDYLIYEDNDLLVVNKPPNIATYNNIKEPGVMELIRMYKNDEKISAAHRLDKETSGVLIFGKNRSALASISKQLTKGEVEKTYVTLVNGVWSDKITGVITPIGSSLKTESVREVINPKEVEERKGKIAGTKIKKMAQFIDEEGKQYSLLEINILNGRTHQIRVHMSYLEHPIVGDKKYGIPSEVPRQMLHNFDTSIRRPRTSPDEKNRMNFRAPMPNDFLDLLSNLKIEAIYSKDFYQVTNKIKRTE